MAAPSLASQRLNPGGVRVELFKSCPCDSSGPLTRAQLSDLFKGAGGRTLHTGKMTHLKISTRDELTSVRWLFLLQITEQKNGMVKRANCAELQRSVVKLKVRARFEGLADFNF